MSHPPSSSELPCTATPAAPLHDTDAARRLADVFATPACRVPVVPRPDATTVRQVRVEPILLGLLGPSPALRVCTLRVPVRRNGDLWTAVANPAASSAIVEVPLVLARSRGAWAVGWSRGGNLAWASAHAVELRVWLVEQLCWRHGWHPAQVPAGAAALLLGRDRHPDETSALPTRDVIGRSQLPELARHLWRIPTGVPERRRRQVTSATIGRFFQDLTRLGTLVRADDTLDAVELPGWMLRR